MNQRLNRWAAVLVVLAAVLISVPVYGQVAKAPDVLSVAPSDAWGVLVIKNLTDFSKKVDAYATQMGMPVPDVQRRWVMKLGLGTQVLTDKPTVVVFMNQQMQVYGEQPVGIIMAVENFDTVCKLLEGEATEVPGLFKGSSPEFETCYLAKKSGYMIVAPTQAVANAILSNTRGLDTVLADAASKMLKDNDLYVHVNLQSIVPAVKPYLQMMGAIGMMGAMQGGGGMLPGGTQRDHTVGGGGDKAQQMQAMMQHLPMVMNGVTQWLEQAESIDLGLTMAPKRLQLSGAWSFKSGTETASLLADQKPGVQSLLSGLPNRPFFLAGGGRYEPKMMKLQKSLLEMNAATMSFESPEDADTYRQLLLDSAMMATGQTFMVSMNPPMGGQGLFSLLAVMETKDAAKYLTMAQNTVALMQKATLPGGVKQSVTYEKGVATVADVSLDQYSVDINSMMNAPGVPQAQLAKIKPMMNMIFGGTDGKMKYRLGAVDDKRIVIGFGADDASMASLIKSAKAGTSPLSSNVKLMQTAEVLPKKRMAEMYVDMGALMASVGPMMQMMMAMNQAQTGSPASMPTIGAMDMPLVAMTATVAGNAVRADLVVPMELIKQLATMGKAMGAGGMAGQGVKSTPSDELKTSPVAQ